MKWVGYTISLTKITRRLGGIAVIMRIFFITAFMTLLFFIISGAIGILQNKYPAEVSPSMKGIAATVSTHFFADLMSMEIPYLPHEANGSALSQTNVLTFLLQYMTNIDVKNPKSLIAHEVPGLNSNVTLFYKGGDSSSIDYPEDYTPPAGSLKPDPDKSGKGSSGPSPSTPAPSAAPTPSPAPPNQGRSAAASKPSIFIYHTHDRESFLPELKGQGITNPDQAYSSKINITQVGDEVVNKLKQLGIQALHSTVDYPSVVSDFNYAKSYAYSNKTVKEAIARDSHLTYFFDIHRDSLGRSQTTTKLNGENYAQIYFIVGKRNPNWEKNLVFAEKLHNKLQQLYPGISKGIYGKETHGNGEYNQSISPTSILVEIGGPDNTMAEMNRTADLLAQIIADVCTDAAKVSGSPAR